MPRNASIRLPESVLRHLWQYQQFIHSDLHATDGRELKIISPGAPNTDGGPDFIDACLRIGGVLYRGDVELHKNYDEWKLHAHHLDPKYNKVILHVVFNGKPEGNPPSTKSRRLLPVLALDHYLIASFTDTPAMNVVEIPCESVNASVDASSVREWIGKLAVERLELKVRRFEERLKELINRQRLLINEPGKNYGEIPFGLNIEELPPPVSPPVQREFSRSHLWNQLLYEGVMEALGYSKNQESFRRLASTLHLRSFAELVSTIPADERLMNIEAILFGVSGLLQQHRRRHDRQSKNRLMELRRRWKEYRPQFHGELLTEADWQFFRLRPENFPTVRLAGAARLIPGFLDGDLFKSVIRIVKDVDRENSPALKELSSRFTVMADGFWKQHYCFGGKSNVRVEKLVGDHRAHDIVLNVVIPVCLLYARLFRDKDVRAGTMRVLERCPSSGDNAMTRIMKQQLLRGRVTIDSAMMQQGVLQLYKSYCTQRRCHDCTIGKAVFVE
jgi:hypothetical protein